MSNQTHAAVAERAYGIWQAEGCHHGHDIDHWLRAEAEILHSAKRPRRAAAANTTVRTARKTVPRRER